MPARKTGVSHGPGFDGLLIECRSLLPGSPPTYRSETEASLTSFDLDQPFEKDQAIADQTVIAQPGPGRNQSLGILALS